MTPLALALALAAGAQAQDSSLKAKAKTAFETGASVSAAVGQASVPQELDEALRLAHAVQTTPTGPAASQERLRQVRRAASLLGADEAACLCLYGRGECGTAELRQARDAFDAQDFRAAPNANAANPFDEKQAQPDDPVPARNVTGAAGLTQARATLAQLNAQGSGLIVPKKPEPPPSTVTDTDRMRTVFNGAIAGMNARGERRDQALLNNMDASLIPGSKKLRCFPQSEVVLAALQEQRFDGWTFSIRSYTAPDGEPEQGNGHWWVEAVPDPKKHPGAKAVTMDPLNNEFTVEATNQPQVKTAPFWTWAMNATLGRLAN